MVACQSDETKISSKNTPRTDRALGNIKSDALKYQLTLYSTLYHGGDSESPGSVQESLAKVFFVLCQSSCLSQFIDCYNLEHFGVTEAECSV